MDASSIATSTAILPRRQSRTLVSGRRSSTAISSAMRGSGASFGTKAGGYSPPGSAKSSRDHERHASQTNWRGRFAAVQRRITPGRILDGVRSGLSHTGTANEFIEGMKRGACVTLRVRLLVAGAQRLGECRTPVRDLANLSTCLNPWRCDAKERTMAIDAPQAVAWRGAKDRKEFGRHANRAASVLVTMFFFRALGG
jgi:hypothetical protein